MAESGARGDAALGFRFRVRIDGLGDGGFSEVSGLQLETEVHDYPEGGLNTHLRKFPTRTKQANLVLKRGIVDRELWDWHQQLVQGRVQRRSGSVIVYDPSGTEAVLEWQLKRAFPIKWQGPELNAAQSSLAVETLELCHEGLERRS